MHTYIFYFRGAFSMQNFIQKKLIIITLACVTTGLHASLDRVTPAAASQRKDVSPFSEDFKGSPLYPTLSDSSFGAATPISAAMPPTALFLSPIHVIWPDNNSTELHTKLNNLLSNEEIERMRLINSIQTAFIELITTKKAQKQILKQELTFKKEQRLQTRIIARRKDAVQALRHMYPGCTLDQTQICPVTGEIFDIRTYQTTSSTHDYFARK